MPLFRSNRQPEPPKCSRCSSSLGAETYVFRVTENDLGPYVFLHTLSKALFRLTWFAKSGHFSFGPEDESEGEPHLSNLQRRLIDHPHVRLRLIDRYSDDPSGFYEVKKPLTLCRACGIGDLARAQEQADFWMTMSARRSTFSNDTPDTLMLDSSKADVVAALDSFDCIFCGCLASVGDSLEGVIARLAAAGVEERVWASLDAGQAITPADLQRLGMGPQTATAAIRDLTRLRLLTDTGKLSLQPCASCSEGILAEIGLRTSPTDEDD